MKYPYRRLGCDPVVSPSTRRAWIEIYASLKMFERKIVALHPEGVD